MRLHKKTRLRLYTAEGPITFKWPQDAPEALAGHKYPVYGRNGKKLFSVRLEAVKRLKSEIRVTARIDNDSFRPMVGIQGTRNEEGDYEPEPERVDSQTENRYAMEGRAKTCLLGAEHRVESKRASQERRLERAKEQGNEQTVKQLERVLR